MASGKQYLLVVNRDNPYGKAILAIPVIDKNDGIRKIRTEFDVGEIQWAGIFDASRILVHKELIYS